MLHCGDDEVSMEWKTLKGKSFQSAFLDREVIGVTDIICDTHREAVNIVIKQFLHGLQTDVAPNLEKLQAEVKALLLFAEVLF